MTRWIDKVQLDNFGRRWKLDTFERCVECGQPDSERDCNHEKLTLYDVLELEGEPNEEEYILITENVEEKGYCNHCPPCLSENCSRCRKKICEFRND